MYVCVCVTVGVCVCLRTYVRVRASVCVCGLHVCEREEWRVLRNNWKKTSPSTTARTSLSPLRSNPIYQAPSLVRRVPQRTACSRPPPAPPNLDSKHATQMCCQACSASSYTTASPLHLAHRLQRPVGQFIDARLATSVIHIHHSQAHLIIAPHVLPVRVVRLKVAAHA